MLYQLARLEYQHRKLKAILAGVYPQFGGNIEFELFSFFEVCYHLKDWATDGLDTRAKKIIEEYVNSSPALRISADICNRLKHRTLRDPKTNNAIQNKRSLAPLGPFNVTQQISIGPNPEGARASILSATIQTERGEECCFALADECMVEWERYFRDVHVTFANS